MSIAATDPHSITRTAAETTESLAAVDGNELPKPTHEPLGATIGFLMATMGSVATVFALCFAIVSVGRGGSLTLWATGASVLALTWLVGTVLALLTADNRGEWG